MRGAVIRHTKLAAVSLAALSGSPLTAAGSAQDAGSLQKVACPFDTTKALLRVSCGRLKVPENYDNPGRTIELAFMTVSPRRNIDSGNPVLYLSGGPGAPSLVYAELLLADRQVHDVVVDREWVFYDQRGEGRSLPTLRCPRESDYMKRVRICRDTLIRQGVDLSQYNSARSARDIEELRKALGLRHWNLWGTSYGSRLAYAVARDFPASVRSIVHDGPSYPEGQEIIDDFRGTEAAINRLLSKCAADTACASTYPDLRSRFLGALPRLRRQPLAVGDERVDDNGVAGYIRGYLFSGPPALLEGRVQSLLAWMDAAARGDGRSMRQIQQRMPEDTVPEPSVPTEGWYSMGQNLSIECNEERPFESLEDYKQAAARSEIVRAMFGPRSGEGQFQICALWPSGRAAPVRKSKVSYDGPQLVFSGELDPSLSGLSGYKIDSIYPNARHVVFRNALHVQVELASFPPRIVDEYRLCALRMARRFFADPQRPVDGRCAETRRVRLVQ